MTKPTIETKILKLEDGKDFVLEYPSNYEDIVGRKLNILDKEYQDVIKAEQNKTTNTNNNDDSDSEEEKKGHEGEVPKQKTQHEEDAKNNDDVNDKEYYQPIGENCDDDDEFLEVQENVEPKIEDFEFVEETNKNDKQPRRRTSPIKNPEKIKNAMKGLNLKAPKWAEGLSDEQFMSRVRNFLNAKNKAKK